MYDPSIHLKTLARSLRKGDITRESGLLDQSHRDTVLRRSVDIGINGFETISLRTNQLGRKLIHQMSNLAEILVVRHVTSNVRRLTGARQDNRQFIITCMQSMLSEGTAFNVYKFDIASFYESVRPDDVCNMLDNDNAFSSQSARAIHSLFEQLKVAGVVGLPRGMPLSATLAEYLMRNFDKETSNADGIWFYARFVDDIVVITNGEEDMDSFQKLTSRRLPQGLKFNSKSSKFSFKRFNKNNASVEEHSFDFLGYHFSVGFAVKVEGRICRDTWLDIAPSKVRKLKTRLTKSLVDHSKQPDFSLLLSRFKMLTSNFSFTDLNSNLSRNSGIYYNYSLINPERSTALLDLDRYLLRAVTSPHPKNRSRPAVDASQRQQLLNLRFSDGFSKSDFSHFHLVS